MICLLLTVLMVVGMVSVIPVNAEIEPVSYIAEKVTSGELAEGDQLIICVENNSAAIGTELSGSRIKPKDVTISTDGEKSVLTDAPYTVALFTVSYSENEKLLLHADEGWLTVPEGGGLTLSDTADAFSEWEIRDDCFLYNCNYTYTNGSYTFNNYYLQYYEKYAYFTTYGKNKSSNLDAFTMSFFKITDTDWASRAKTIYTLPLFETSDIHGALVNSSTDPYLHYLARISDIVKDARSSDGSYDKSRALLIDTGDIYQGNTISNLLDGNPLRAAFDKMDYDAVSVGNHEFDWGLDASVDSDSTMADYTLDDVKYENKIPVVLSNFYVNGEKQTWLNDYVILEKSAVSAAGDPITVKIAVIGFAEDYSKSVKTSAFGDLGYEIREDYDALNTLASTLEASGACDATVLLTHAEAQKIANHLGAGTAIDLVFGGHTHYNKSGRTTFGVRYLQPAAYGTAYTTATLRFNMGVDKPVLRDITDAQAVSISEPASLLYVNEENMENLDQEVVAIAREALTKIQPLLEEIVGAITIDALRLDYSDPEQKRNCTGGNWLCSIYARIVDAEVAFVNRGGIRTEFTIPEGAEKLNITLSDVYMMFPFGNPVYRYDVTYADLLEAVRYSLTSNGKGLLTYVTGIDIYYEGATVNALVKDGTLIYQNGEWVDGWDEKTVSIAVDEYVATNNRESEIGPNPLIAWNDTEKLVSGLTIDNEGALKVLREESQQNDGYLYIDAQQHYHVGDYTEPVLLGDVDGSGDVTILDATFIQRKLAGIPIPFEFNDTVADTDEDDDVTIIDANYIQRWLAALSSNEHIGQPIK